MKRRLCPLLVLASAVALADLGIAATVTLGGGEYRSVELAPDVDAIEWAQRNDVDFTERLPVAGGGTILRFPAEEGVWRARRQAMCTDTGVLACDADFCQTYFVPAEEEAELPGSLPTPPQPAAPPDVTPVAAEEEEARLQLKLIESEEQDVDDGIVQANVIAGDGAVLAGARVLLVPRAPDVSSLFDAPADAGIADAATTPGERHCRSTTSSAPTLLTTLSGADGSFKFPRSDAENLDRGCWEVITAASCEARVQPLADLLPEREPGRLLALIKVGGDGKGSPDSIAQAVAQATGLRLLEATSLESIGKVLLRLEMPEESRDLRAALAQLRSQAGIDSAQPEYRYRTSAQYNDPYAWLNYGAQLTGADRLQAETTGAGVKIALIDSGVDAEHPELAARLAERIDVTGFGLSADRHGTAIAGLIAGEANNALGAFGMAPGATLISIKACEAESKHAVEARCWSSTLAKALDAALERDARVINLSLGGPRDRLVGELIDAALALARLVIAAAGNGGPDAAPAFPAVHPGVIAVTAVDARERLYSQATRGDFIDVAAPGVEVPVPVPGSTYPGQLSGTSMAAAHVSGIAALLFSRNPALEPQAAREALESSAKDLGTPAADAQFGRGRVDACAAALAATNDPTVCRASAEAR